MIRIITVVKLTETFMEEEVLIIRPAWECVCEQTNMLALQQTSQTRCVSSIVSAQRDSGQENGSFSKRCSQNKVRTKTALILRISWKIT